VIEKRSKRVGLLGGSFNPVHIGHLHIANELKTRLRLDEVWFIPAYQNPHKMDQNIAPAALRLEMLRLATAHEPSFKVLDVECKRGGPSFTVDTVKSLNEQYPNIDFFLLLGADTIKKFHEWKDPRKIIELCTLVIASRENESFNIDFEHKALKCAILKGITPVPLLNASSTEIRSLIKKGEDFQGHVAAPVFKFITDNYLYF
jgi:nicotinate-nucleotide adenylyltransferase